MKNNPLHILHQALLLIIRGLNAIPPGHKKWEAKGIRGISLVLVRSQLYRRILQSSLPVVKLNEE